MASRQFPPEEVARCRAAMAKPGPIGALRLLASGRVIVELARDGSEVFIDRCDGQAVRDPEHPDCKMGLAGSWPLYRAGMIDDFGCVTSEGYAVLAAAGADRHGQ